MELIKEIFEKDVVAVHGVKQPVSYRLRKASRALLFRENTIALLFASALHIHKLPGGGIEEGESITAGLSREILEETGCTINTPHELGITIEYRDSIELLQISYVFRAAVSDSSAYPRFTQKEKDEGFSLQWYEVGEAIRIIKQEDTPSTYAGKFIHARDLAILEYSVSHSISSIT